MMEYRLVRTKRTTMAIYIRPKGEVEVRVPAGTKKSVVDSFVASKDDWIRKNLNKMEEIRSSAAEVVIPETELPRYKEQLADLLRERCDHFSRRMGVTYGKIRINRARSRWASCSGKGDLNFSVALLFLPSHLVDYIVVHELGHRREMNHSDRFWTVVEEEMPDYRERKEQLTKLQRKFKLVIR